MISSASKPDHQHAEDESKAGSAFNATPRDSYSYPSGGAQEESKSHVVMKE